MRFITAGFVVVLSALTASAQDAATIAAQQAAEANLQAAEAAQQANEQAAQAAAQTPAACCHVATPKISVKSGSYPSAVTLRIKDSSRGTYIYYTTDGWTPTPSSRRYTGPITISSNTTLQAIAVDARNNRSSVATADYTIAGSSPRTPSTTFLASGLGQPVLLTGTPLPLVFTSAVSSRGVRVGDSLPVALAQDLTVGGVLLASKGTPVSAKVTQVDNSGLNGLPGTLTFEVHSMQLNDGATLLLSGTRTQEGRSRTGTAAGLAIIPLGSLFVRGKDAQIHSGARLIAHVRSVTTHRAPLDASSAGDEQP